jgi:type II secretory pathway component PulF
MPLIFTPGQFAQHSEFYYQLGQLTAAGVGIPAALGQIRRNPPARSYRLPLSVLLERLAAGCTLSEAVQQLGSWFPEFDVALVRAGEQSGRLEGSLQLLADYYRDRARMARQAIGDLAYPVFLFHFALFIFAFVQWVRVGDGVAFMVQTFGVLLIIYSAVALAVYAFQSRHSERWRSWMERMLDPVPVLGTARRYLALSRLAAALEALLSAGVSIINAWELAAAASGSPALRRLVLGWRPLLEAGRTPAEVVSDSSRFPELFVNEYATGEISGKLDETLERLGLYYQEEGSRKLHSVAQWTPRAIYLAVMLGIAFFIVRWWADYFRQVGAAGGF